MFYSLRPTSQPDGQLGCHHVREHPPLPPQALHEHGPEVRLRIRLFQGMRETTKQIYGDGLLQCIFFLKKKDEEKI